jgi:hypothetical protein
VVAEKRVFSAEAFELGGLGVLDADVGLRVARLVLPGPAGKPVEVEQVVLRLVLADRDLALRPFGFVLAGSHVAGDARVNGRVAPPAMVLDVAAQQADLGRLLALSGVALPVTAKADLVLALRGAGASPRALAAAQGDVWFINGQPIEDVKALVADVAARPRRDAALRYGLSAFVIARKTEEEAGAAYDRLARLAALDAPMVAQQAVHTDPNVVMKHTMAKSDRLGTNGGTAAGLVGTYAQVAERMKRFHEAGIETFMLQYQPFEAEMRRFAAEVMPLVKR